MSNHTCRSDEESPSSDEKMDTWSDSPSPSPSQGTPHSNSYSDELDAGRSQRPHPAAAHATCAGPRHVRPGRPLPRLTIVTDTSRSRGSPPRHSSALTTTTSHPLMGHLPDLVPKKVEEPESLSSIEEDKNDTFYSPQRNTSKNNLYLTEFLTAESVAPADSSGPRPAPALAPALARRKIVPQLGETPPPTATIHFAVNGHSTPIADHSLEEFHSVLEWAEASSRHRGAPPIDLPIEMCAPAPALLHTAQENEGEGEGEGRSSAASPSSQWSLQALLEPRAGRAALHLHHVARRKIHPPVEEDGSLDSLSDASLDSDAEGEGEGEGQGDEDEHTKGSVSSHTGSASASRASSIPEYSLAEEMSRERTWRSVPSQRQLCDMKVIEPYKRVLSHGGYADGLALVVFAACHLPDTSRTDYTYVMDNLFLYVVWSLERLVTDQYAVVYLHGGAPRRLPALAWTHAAYKLIDCRLRKSLKRLYLVHPTFWLKSFVLLTKPFVSSKFFKKLSYIKSLDELLEKVPVEPNAIPDRVWEYDRQRKS